MVIVGGFSGGGMSPDFPSRPLSVEEVLGLRDHVEVFDHTAPLIGLKSESSGRMEVIGVYLGFGGGAHLSGFDPGLGEWVSVSVLKSVGGAGRGEFGDCADALLEWLQERYSGEDFVMYASMGSGVIE
ncbi:hypothetical protein [Halobacterium wangiae]|uniref:hypothetical protein n=1 Tax=Halobacterium wangiae TaxID=2902623 RepID=UPI001E35FAFF|nr:hypothetical protein [Halobacterium wangiae]